MFFFQKSNVLDTCNGAGLRVCFSDFNREVIEQVTIPNVKLNVEERYWPLAEYYSGDWNSLSPLLEEVMPCAVMGCVVCCDEIDAPVVVFRKVKASLDVKPSMYSFRRKETFR